jgi:hypothetical protein
MVAELDALVARQAAAKVTEEEAKAAWLARQAAAKASEEEAKGAWLARQAAAAKALAEEAKAAWLARPDLSTREPGIAVAVAPARSDAPAAITGAMEKQAKKARRKRRFMMRKTRSRFLKQAKEPDQTKVEQKVKATTEAFEAVQAKGKEDKARADAEQVQREKEHRARLEAAFNAAKAAAEAARAAAEVGAEGQVVADAQADEGEEIKEPEAAEVKVEHASADAGLDAIQAMVDAEQEFQAKLKAMEQAKINAKEDAKARALAQAEAAQVKAEREHRAKLEAVAKARAMEEAKARKAARERAVSPACSAAKDVARTPELTEDSECAILTWLDQLDQGTAVPTPAAATKSKPIGATSWTVTIKRSAKKPLEWLAKATVGVIALWTGGSSI